MLDELDSRVVEVLGLQRNAKGGNNNIAAECEMHVEQKHDIRFNSLLDYNESFCVSKQ